jgi:hypothetical protein
VHVGISKNIDGNGLKLHTLESIRGLLSKANINMDFDRIMALIVLIKSTLSRLLFYYQALRIVEHLLFNFHK